MHPIMLIAQLLLIQTRAAPLLLCYKLPPGFQIDDNKFLALLNCLKMPQIISEILILYAVSHKLERVL